MSDPNVLSTEETGAPAGGDGGPSREATRSLLGDALYELRRNPIVWFAAVVAVVVMLMAVFPGLFTNADPGACSISRGRERPSAEHWFGYTFQGCDMWAKIVYGASRSLAVAVLATIAVTLLGITLGTIAAFYGGWTDTIIGRITDIFFGLPFLLGAIVFLAIFTQRNVWTIAAVFAVLGWTTFTRLMRGSVLSTKNRDYVEAARALGASNRHIIFQHILPNSLAPAFVYATIYLGSAIGAEATLTFLGVGFRQPNHTWGLLIAEGQPWALQGYPHLLVIPCTFVVITVLAFILLGDALRDALDPRTR